MFLTNKAYFIFVNIYLIDKDISKNIGKHSGKWRLSIIPGNSSHFCPRKDSTALSQTREGSLKALRAFTARCIPFPPQFCKSWCER